MAYEATVGDSERTRLRLAVKEAPHSLSAATESTATAIISLGPSSSPPPVVFIADVVAVVAAAAGIVGVGDSPGSL